jgi:TetR/AcrR family transcriptional regulator, transcriptional repressor for nem operon
MRRGSQTRGHIIEQAAALFNQKGYAGASVSDIMSATGLQKGAIYRHFESKEALAVEAFGFSVQRLATRFVAALEGKESARDRLRAILAVYAEIPTNPPVPGGCPILNASVEHDDGYPVLRGHVREAMEGLRRLVRHTVRRGIERGEVRAGVDADAVANLVAASLQGGVLLGGLYGDEAPMQDVVRELEAYLSAIVLV